MNDPRPTAPGGDERVRARHVLRTAGRVYHGHFTRIAGTALIVFGATAAIDTVVTTRQAASVTPIWVVAFLGSTALFSFGATFYAGLLDRLVGARVHGRADPPIGEVLRSLPYGRLIVADVLLTLVTAVMLLFLVLPGVFAFTRFALVGPLINIEQLGVRAAFRRSAQLVKGRFWLVAGLVTLPVALEGQLEALLELGAHGKSLVIAFLVHGLLGAIVGAAIGLVEVSLAYELVARHPEAPAAEKAN